MTDLHIVLVFPEIPWNTGNAGRTCLAAGAQLHLVEPLGFSLEDRYLRRSGLDYWPAVRPRVWSRWGELEEALPGLGQPFVVTPEAGRSYWQVRYPKPTVLIFGREGIGLPPELREEAPGHLFAQNAQQISIPMEDGVVRSLNLSTSVAVAAYEVRRQWMGHSPATGSYRSPDG